MTAARSTMSDTMHLRRTIGQLGRIALHSSRNARSAPVSPTDVHVCHMVRSKIASTSMVKSPDLSSGHENLLDAIMTLSDHDLHLPSAAILLKPSLPTCEGGMAKYKWEWDKSVTKRSNRGLRASRPLALPQESQEPSSEWLAAHST